MSDDMKKRGVVLILLIIIILASLVTLIYSGYEIYSWNKDNIEIDNQIKEIEEIVDVKRWTELANVRAYYDFFKKYENDF